MTRSERQPAKTAMSDQLYILSLSQPYTVAVPYHADMPIYQYLRDVLAPALRSHTAHDGATVVEAFMYNRPDGIQVRFTRDNRLDRLGDVVPPEANLHRMLSFLGRPDERLHGNATRGDITKQCVICREDGELTDYELQTCAHRFHAHCMCMHFVSHAPGATRRCPVCREQLSHEDEWGAWRIVAIRAEAGGAH